MRTVWEPSEELLAHSNLARVLRSHGLSLAELQRRALDPEWFWAAVVADLGVVFDTPARQVADISAGAEWTRWFTGGQLNLAATCLDQWAAATPDAPAVRWEGEDGETRVLSYRELRAMADQVANGLAALGVATGDVVGMYLPMLPEAVAVFYACAKLGAIVMPMFSGYEASAVAFRLAGSDARVLITADGCYRRGKVVPMLEAARQAAAAAPALRQLVVIDRLRIEDRTDDPPRDDVQEVSWDALIGGQPAEFATRSLAAEAQLTLCYTSGTTGQPKGAMHTHIGLLLGVAKDAAYHMDVRHEDTLFWVTDMGWIMGPWEIVAAGTVGATLVLYDGAPVYPGPGRLLELAERHKVTVLGVSPSLIRGLAAAGAPAAEYDLSALRILGATGEPWDSSSWTWLFDEIGRKRCPIINMSGGTEVGAAFLAPTPLQGLSPCTLGGPALGMDVDIFTADGRPAADGEVGELVCKSPWPAMTKGLWRDTERYLDSYWRRWPGVWVQGDWASRDADGYWYLHGRSDDTLNVAGKRLGPAEVESALAGHPAVAEAAAVGLPHPVKGEAIWCFVMVRPGWTASDSLSAELQELVAAHLGKAFRPEAVVFTDDLPRTRSAKLVRRAIRAAATGGDPGDLVGIENPAAIDGIRAVLASRQGSQAD
jgi:acetyl-CoA synthetase